MENPDKDGWFKQEGYDPMAAAFEVYNEKGHGFAEEVYQECPEHELTLRGIPFASKPELPIHYKGVVLKKHYYPDLLTHGAIIAELKAASRVLAEHEAQLLNDLKATGLKVGYLINFGHPQKLEWKRMVL